MISTELENLAKLMDEGVSLSNEKSELIYLSPALCSWLEIEGDSYKGKNAYDYIKKDDHEKIQALNLADFGKTLSNVEMTLISESGKEIPTLLNGMMCEDGAFMGLLKNIEQSQTEEIIYKKLIQHMQEAVCITDKDGNATFANPRMCHLLGREFHEVVGKSASLWLDTASQKKVQKIDQHVRKKGISSNYSINIITKLGNTIPVSLSGTPLPDGGTIGIMTDLREIKERKEKEKILYDALQFSSDGVIMCNSEGIIQSWNRGAQLIFGKKYDQVYGKHLREIFGESNAETLLALGGDMNKIELEADHESKDKIITSITQTPLYNQSGNLVISYLLVCRDITNYRKIENEYADKVQKIKEAYKNYGMIKREQDYIFELLSFAKKNHHNPDLIYQYIVNAVMILSQVDAVELTSNNFKKNKLHSLAHTGFDDSWNHRKSIEYSSSITKKAYESGSSVKYLDINLENDYKNKSISSKLGFTSLMLIPLSTPQKCIGALALYTKSDKKFEIFENEFIEQYARVIERVIEEYL